MQSFDQFCLTEQEINEAFMDRVRSMSDKLVKKAKKLLIGLEFERNETVFMLETFFTKLKELLSDKDTVTDEDVKRALHQLKDVGKFALIAPLFLLPGGGTTTAVLYMAGKKFFGISILPQGLEQVFEVVYDVKKCTQQIAEMEDNLMKDFDEYIDEQIDESSLSRIWRHVQAHEAGALSGYRDENNDSQNKTNNKEIKAFLLSKGYSVTPIQGNYIENFKTDSAKEVGEPSFFVVDQHDKGDLKRDLLALGRKYDQDSVLIVPKGGKNAYLYGTSKRDNAFPDYGKRVTVGNSTFGDVKGQFLSRVNGREFAFESTEQPVTRNGKWAMSIIAKRIDEDLNENGYYND